MKRPVICPLCNKDLGKYHSNASGKLLRDHIYEDHSDDYHKIVKIVSEIEYRYDLLKMYGISHWTKDMYHNNVAFEKELENQPPLTEEQRERLLKSIMRDE